MRRTTLYSKIGKCIAPADGLSGLLRLYRSVGTRGVNSRHDVSSVQSALNGVPASLGGPVTPLSIDGLAGPLTNGAIMAFQTGWLDLHDGRIDPGGLTLACLNAAIGAPTARVPGDLPPRATGPAAVAWGALGAAVVGATGLAAQRHAAPSRGAMRQAVEPEMLAIIRAVLRLDDLRENVLLGVELTMKKAVSIAERAFDYARALTTPTMQLPGWNGREVSGRLAFLLVAKHFHLSERQPDRALAATARVLEVARRIRMRTISRRGAFGVLHDQSDRYVATFRTPARHPPPAAYNVGLGSADVPPHPTPHLTPSYPPNARFERTDRIYLTPLWDGLTNLQKQATLIHELAHFTGGVSPGITDHAYAFDPDYRTLSPAQRLSNTDTYSMYFCEPEMGSANTAAAHGISIPDMGSLPFVEPTGQIVLPGPPSGSPDVFAFPCTFPVRPHRP